MCTYSCTLICCNMGIYTIYETDLPSLLSLQDIYWLMTYPQSVWSGALSTKLSAQLWPLLQSCWVFQTFPCTSLPGCSPAWMVSWDLPTRLTAQLWPVPHHHGCSVRTCPLAWLLSCDLSTSASLTCPPACLHSLLHFHQLVLSVSTWPPAWPWVSCDLYTSLAA